MSLYGITRAKNALEKCGGSGFKLGESQSNLGWCGHGIPGIFDDQRMLLPVVLRHCVRHACLKIEK